VPETFFVEVGSVLRRWDLNAILTPDQINDAVRQLATWPLRVVQVRPLFADAWRLRKNLTFADATYVALAERLDAELLTDTTSWPTRRRWPYVCCDCRSAHECQLARPPWRTIPAHSARQLHA
jgi:hypothetical protein